MYPKTAQLAATDWMTEMSGVLHNI